MPHTLHRRLLCDLRRERQPHLLLFVVHVSEQRFTIIHVPPRGCVCRAKIANRKRRVSLAPLSVPCLRSMTR